MSRFAKLKDFLETFDGKEIDTVSSIDVFGEVTVSPSNETLKIDMDEDFSIEKYKEAVTFAISSQGTDITVRAYKRIVRFLEQRAEYWLDRSNQIKVEVLLIVAKVSHTEFYERQKQLDSSADVGVSHCISSMLSNLVESFMAPSVIFCNVESSKEKSLVPGKIKEFLKKPLIILALKNALSKFFAPQEVENHWLEQRINSMKIYTTVYLSPLSGSALSDGILLISQNILWFDEWPKYRQAGLLTLAVHVTIHFLARCLSNDFNFSSSPYSFNEVIEEDPLIPNKPLELGRAVELELFSCQPFWQWPKNHYCDDDVKVAESAAEEFFFRLERMATLPLFTMAEVDKVQIKRQEWPSLSSGAEFVFSDRPNIYLMID